MAIFIIPGFLKKSEFYSPLAKRLRESGFSAEIVDFGYNTQNLEKSSDVLLAYLGKTSGKDDFIAHSYGGIILKYLLSRHPEAKEQIKSIIFASVPHGGSWSALLFPYLPAAREMWPFKKRLKDLLKMPLPEGGVVNFISEKELKIWPRKGALLTDCLDIVVPGTDHDSIVNNKSFMSKTVEFLKSNYDRIFLENV